MKYTIQKERKSVFKNELFTLKSYKKPNLEFTHHHFVIDGLVI